jgi:hypothetical protein
VCVAAVLLANPYSLLIVVLSVCNIHISNVHGDLIIVHLHSIDLTVKSLVYYSVVHGVLFVCYSSASSLPLYCFLIVFLFSA